MERQKWFSLLGVIFLVLIIVTLPLTNAHSAAMDPIKIGVLVPETGPFTQVGNNIKSGLKIAFDEVGWKLAGREVKLIIEDTEAKPPVALQKARKLVESDRVNIVAGVVHSGVAIALRDYIDRQKVPLLISCATADVITGVKASKYIFRTSYNSEMQAVPIAAYTYKVLKGRKAYLFAQDYALGHDTIGWFKRSFEKLGGKVVGEVFNPFGTTDFAPYLTKIKGVDVVGAFEAGTDGIQFVKQFDEYGLKKKIPHLVSLSNTFQAYMLAAQKDSALGAICSSAYAVGLNIPENRKLIKTYAKMSGGRDPDDIVESSYIAGRVIIEGINDTKGNIQDVPRLLESFRKVKLTTPRGPFAFDEKQNSICDIFIEKVVKKEGRYTRDIIHTYKNVHQGWTP